MTTWITRRIFHVDGVNLQAPLVTVFAVNVTKKYFNYKFTYPYAEKGYLIRLDSSFMFCVSQYRSSREQETVVLWQMLGWNARQCSPVFIRWHYCLSPRWQRRNLFRRFLCKYNLKWNANIYCLAEEWICQSFYLIFYCGQTNVESWVAVFIDSGSVSIIFKLWYYNFQFKMLWHRISVQMFRVQSRIRVESRSKNASTNIVLIKVIINVALMDGDIRKKQRCQRCHIF